MIQHEFFIKIHKEKEQQGRQTWVGKVYCLPKAQSRKGTPKSLSDALNYVKKYVV